MSFGGFWGRFSAELGPETVADGSGQKKRCMNQPRLARETDYKAFGYENKKKHVFCFAPWGAPAHKTPRDGGLPPPQTPRGGFGGAAAPQLGGSGGRGKSNVKYRPIMKTYFPEQKPDFGGPDPENL